MVRSAGTGRPLVVANAVEQTDHLAGGRVEIDHPRGNLMGRMRSGLDE